MGDPVRIEAGAAIDWIVLDRPDAANAFSAQMLEGLSQALDRLRSEGAPVIGIRGAGRGFSAGADLSEYNAAATPMQDVARLRRNVERWLEIWHHPKPVILAVHGFCMGIAAQMLAFADLVVVAGDARISEPRIPLGGGYIAPAWTALVGGRRAKEFAFLPGNEIDGETAVSWGLANAAVPTASVVPCVEQIAARMALVPPSVLAMKKQSINRAMEAQGFVVALSALAESDAILHFEPDVLALRKAMAEQGLKHTLKAFHGPSSAAIFETFKKDLP